MPTFQLNGQTITVPEGTTILEAAREHGIQVPSMCEAAGLPHNTSCMLCLVRDADGKRLIPSCTALVTEGMRIETDDEEITASCRAAVELLLSEHLGDCEAPCRRACPAGLDIPRMLTEIASGNDAIAVVKTHIPLARILGRICSAPCEKACRRGQHDQPVSICRLKQYAADRDAESWAPFTPKYALSSGKRVAVVGAGPAGLCLAWFLLRAGYACTILEKEDAAGGGLRREALADRLPRDVLEAEIDTALGIGATLKTGKTIQNREDIEALRKDHDAVVLACGAIDRERAETLGFEYGENGLRVDPAGMTSLPGVFACGDAVKPRQQAVHAVGAAGRTAKALIRFLGGESGPEMPAFSSFMPHLSEKELDGLVLNADPSGRIPDAKPEAPLSEADARREAARCLHCECGTAVSCVLRHRAAETGAAQHRYAGDKPFPFTRQRTGKLVFERGKCVKCGICVRISEEARLQFGFSFRKRGFSLEVGIPFDEPIDADETVQEQLATACPTGAIVFTGKEEVRGW